MEVPFLTSQMLHLKASALFLKVQTLQSQKPSSAAGFACLFGLQSSEEWGKGEKRDREQEKGGDSKSQALVSRRNFAGIQRWKLRSGDHPPTLFGD